MEAISRPSNMYATMRGRGGRRVNHGEKAVIAARFEDCRENLAKLYFACLNFKQHLPDIDATYAGEILALLTAWGDETGANDQSLDRRLRLSSDLRDQVVDFLGQLQSCLKEGLEHVEGIQAAGVHLQAGDEDIQDQDDIGPKDEPQTSELIDEVHEILASAAATLDDLRSLTQDVHDPYPTDLDVRARSAATSASGDTEEYMDIGLTQEMFPLAPRKIVERLGRANWRRRQYLKLLHDNRKSNTNDKPASRAAAGQKKAARRDIAVDAFNFQQPELKQVTLQTRGPARFMPQATPTTGAAIPRTPQTFHKSPPSTVADSEIGSPSVFSKATKTVPESVTTVSIAPSKADPTELIVPSYQVKRLEVPQPPKPLDDKRSFVCQFCDFEVNMRKEIQTFEDWEQHVFEDIMTYLCTFEDCIHAARMYGIKDEWYRHELHTHRILKLWICEACKEEYRTKDQLKQHLLEVHADDFPSESDASRMLTFLRPTHSRKPLVSQRCPLCRLPLEPEHIKEHVGEHLEQLALTLIDGDSSTEDDFDETMSQSFDDNMSERGTKLQILENFVKEQLININVDDGTHPPEIDAVEDRDDISDDDGASHDWRVQELGERLSARGRSALDVPSLAHGIKKSPSVTGISATLPLLHTRTFARNEDFMGRDRELANLYTILSEPGRVYVLSAEAGMGKTALAVEFTYAFEQSFHYIFWVQAETRVGAMETFIQIAIQLNLAPPGSDQQTLVTKAREYLEDVRDKKWLLVFDNVEKWDDIDEFTPEKTSVTNGAILITTRHQGLTAPSRPVNYYRKTLEELGSEEGRRLLIHGLPRDLRPDEMSIRDPEYKIAGDIAQLAGLPLAIIYISGYMKAMGTRPSDFWSYWESWRLEHGQLGGKKETGTRGSLESVMTMALGDLGIDALKILRIIAFLDSDGVQRDLLVLDAGIKGPTCLMPTRFRVIINELVRKNFVSVRKQDNRETYVIHRALQSQILTELYAKARHREELFKIAFELVRYRLPRPSTDSLQPHKWNQFKEYLPHVASLQRVYTDPLVAVPLKPFLGLAELFKDGGVLLWQRYISGDAMKLLTSAEKIIDALEGDNDNLRIEVHITINLLLQYFGISHRRESNERLGKILQFRKKRMEEAGPENVSAEEKILLLNASADYANSMLQFNNYKEAEPIYEDCHRRFLELGPEESMPFAFAKLCHHMAYCKMYQRKFDEAIRLANRAVTLIGQLDDKHLVLRYKFDLACITLQKGDKETALRLHEEILADRLTLIGRNSYFTLQSQYAVGALYSYMNRLDEAEQLMRSALQKSEERGGRNFWPDAAVARTKFHLSQIMDQKAGQKIEGGEAERLAKEGKDILSTLLVYDPINGVREEDTGALFDHLQPVFGGRFTGLTLLNYVS